MIDNEKAVQLRQFVPALNALTKSVERSLQMNTYNGTGGIAFKSYNSLQQKIAEILPDDFYVVDALKLEHNSEAGEREQVAQVQLAASQMLTYLESLLESVQKEKRGEGSFDFNFSTDEESNWRNIGRDFQDQVLRTTRETLRRAMKNIDIDFEAPPRPPRPPRPPFGREKRKRGMRIVINGEDGSIESEDGDEDIDLGNLSGANLSGQSLRERDFNGQDLSGAVLTGADLRLCNFHEANLSGAALAGANMRDCNLSSANLEAVNGQGANLTAANLTDAILTDAKFTGANMRDCNLSNVKADNVNFSGVNAKATNFSHANLQGMNARGANLRDAIFDHANLQGAELMGANLRVAGLDDTNFSGADLRGANLRGVNATNANFSGADLEEANLTEANLEGTNMENANVEGARLIEAVMPDGKIYSRGMDVAQFGLKGTPNDQ
ncbi:MAG: pentapeptide repeat-containing protein [Aggregatilineales bacterium]